MGAGLPELLPEPLPEPLLGVFPVRVTVVSVPPGPLPQMLGAAVGAVLQIGGTLPVPPVLQACSPGPPHPAPPGNESPVGSLLLTGSMPP